MKERTPIKRAKQLQPLSRDHHHTLLLCWKIRKGFANDVAPERIKKYADWFFENHILPHFVAEESYIFPILGSENELVKKALTEHRRLTRLFNDNQAEKSLSLIEEELEKHIRFEERILFNEIQQAASEEQLALITSLHEEHSFVDLEDDEFWK